MDPTVIPLPEWIRLGIDPRLLDCIPAFMVADLKTLLSEEEIQEYFLKSVEQAKGNLLKVEQFCPVLIVLGKNPFYGLPQPGEMKLEGPGLQLTFPIGGFMQPGRSKDLLAAGAKHIGRVTEAFAIIRLLDVWKIEVTAEEDADKLRDEAKKKFGSDSFEHIPGRTEQLLCSVETKKGSRTIAVDYKRDAQSKVVLGTIVDTATDPRYRQMQGRMTNWLVDKDN